MVSRTTTQGKKKRYIGTAYHCLLSLPLICWNSTYVDENYKEKSTEKGLSAFCQQGKAGVQQGSICDCLLYVLYTEDIPATTETTTGTFEDDSAIISDNDVLAIASPTIFKSIGTKLRDG